MTNEERHKKAENYWTLFVNSDTEEDLQQMFTSIYYLCVQDLIAYGTGMGFDVETCEDAIHDVFCTLYTKRKKLGKVQNITGYIFRAFKNRMLNTWKKDAKMSDMEVSKLPFTTNVTVLDTLIDSEKREEIKDIIEDLLNSLTDRQREAIYLRYMQNMDYEEISELMGMNVASVRKLVYRAISSLREKSGDLKNPLLSTLLLLMFSIRS